MLNLFPMRPRFNSRSEMKILSVKKKLRIERPIPELEGFLLEIPDGLLNDG